MRHIADQQEDRESAAASTPSLPLLHAAFLLAGFGTLLLGPLLPLLSARWHLEDARSGLLLLAQFCGATLGGGTVTSRLVRDLVLGLGCAGVGFIGFALAPGLVSACAALLLGGYGVGRVISAANIFAGRRYTEHRASALSWLNFSWSCGALFSPLLAAWVPAWVPLAPRLIALAGCFLTVGLLCLLQMRRAARAEDCATRPSPAEPVTTRLPERRLDRSLLLYFAALLIVYGGLETCLSAWLTTFALRYAKASLMLSEYILVLLLSGLTAGRALAAWLLLRMHDQTLQRLALGLTAALTAGLALSHGTVPIAALAVMLGVSLAPIFPATFSLLMARQPSARQAGMILAASGLGAAGLPALMGVVSTRSGSLQEALTLPVLAALTMLLLTMRPPAFCQDRRPIA